MLNIDDTRRAVTVTTLNWKFFPAAPLEKSRAGTYDLGIAYEVPPDYLQSTEGRSIAALQRRHLQRVLDKLTGTLGWRIEEWVGADTTVIRGINLINVKVTKRAESSGKARIVAYKLHFKSSTEAHALVDLVGFGSWHTSPTEDYCIKMPNSIRDDTEEWHEYVRTTRDRKIASVEKTNHPGLTLRRRVDEL
ncbi:hypothetical protein B0H65DRAFT_463552 [Neurospora tetraspora]|uniref:Uncharacterized protein n=1 Tax=Neurospora tetraspora TaxID=94610 RepID=A0AAE0JJ28_9PEZI|nr:hypothetical protein B0H65DRAFT_463552 [Neurospora tetraspora]